MAQPHLSKDQQFIAGHWNRPVLVMAPVGTGKTMALAARASTAIENGILPERMLCLSFTNRAAREVQSRVGGSVACLTFHALCAQILRAEAETLGLAGDFIIYDEEDATEICGRLAEKHQLEVGGQSNRVRYAIWQAISESRLARYEEVPPRKPKEVFLASLKDSGLWPAYQLPEVNYAALVSDYVTLLRDSHAVDFTDLVLGVATLFDEFPYCLAWWQKRYDWIQVDEVQDTSRVEYRILDALAGGHRQLSFFGDVDQTIYEWRGSAPFEILEQYKRDYQPTVMHFEENFRSTRNILSVCEKVILSHPNRLAQRIISKVSVEGEPVALRQFPTAREEYEWIAQQIQRWKGDGQWRDFAILVRTNFTARDISEAMELAAVPHVRVEAEKFFQRAEIKAAIAHLRILRNPQESGALHRFLQVPAKGIGEATLTKIAALPKDFGLHLGDLLQTSTHREGDPHGALLNHPSVVVDTETTGLDVHTDEVVELAALKGTQEFYRILRPTRPELWQRLTQASAIHGWTRERVEAEGVEAQQAFREFAEFIAGCVVVGHNLHAYDWPLLERQSLTPFAPAGTADTLDISRRLLKLNRYNLSNIVESLGLPQRDAHQAMEDVRMTADVLTVLKQRLAAHSEDRREMVRQVGKRFADLAIQVDDWRRRSKTQRPIETLDMILEEGGLNDYFNEDARADNLGELRAIISRMRTLDEALEVASLGLDLEKQLGDEDRVRILTVHQAKGLEFDTVFVAKAVDGEFPSWRSMKEGRLDEEHRLFYVAVSRAKRRMAISWQMRDSSGRSQSPSRYLRALR